MVIGTTGRQAAALAHYYFRTVDGADAKLDIVASRDAVG